MNKKIIARLIILGLLFGVAWFVRHRQEQQQVRIEQSRPPATPKPDKPASGGRGRDVQLPTTNGNADVPKYAIEILQYVRAYGEPPGGYVGGREFMNKEKRLPAKGIDGKKIRYSEWDVHPRKEGQNRGAERLVTGSDHSAWYTRDHYKSFTKIE